MPPSRFSGRYTFNLPFTLSLTLVAVRVLRNDDLVAEGDVLAPCYEDRTRSFGAAVCVFFSLHEGGYGCAAEGRGRLPEAGRAT